MTLAARRVATLALALAPALAPAAATDRAAAAAMPGAAVLALRSAVGVAPPAASPYRDPAVTGGIVLLDEQGRVRTSGRTTDAPFVASARGTTPGTDAYAAKGSRATLLLFQPRLGADPQTWNGARLTGGTPYDDPSRPTAAGDPRRSTLATVLAELPPRWAGHVQLRLILGSPGSSAQTLRYDAADLVVDGDGWQQSDPPVASGTAVPGGVARARPTDAVGAASGAGARVVPEEPTAIVSDPGPRSGLAQSSAAAGRQRGPRASVPAPSGVTSGTAVSASPTATHAPTGPDAAGAGRPPAPGVVGPPQADDQRRLGGATGAAAGVVALALAAVTVGGALAVAARRRSRPLPSQPFGD